MELRNRKNLNVLLPCIVTLGVCSFGGLFARTIPRILRRDWIRRHDAAAYSAPTMTTDKTVTVAFDGNVAPGLPWPL